MEKYVDSDWNFGDSLGDSVEHYSTTVGGYAVKAINWLGRWTVFVAALIALSASVASDQLAYEAGRRAAEKDDEAVVTATPTFAGITPVEAKALELQWFIAQQQRKSHDRE